MFDNHANSVRCAPSLPTGLIDKQESAEAAALRELKEETGYVGTVLRWAFLRWELLGFP